jgi:carboxymethylenebutenolidase
MPDTIISQDVDLVGGYMARPMAEGKYPAIVIIQEWWGLDEHIRDVTRRFAREGYIALAPDLYHGEITNDPQQAGKFAGSLDRSRAVRDTQAAMNYLKDSEYSNGKMGVIGYCLGGGVSLLTACSDSIDAGIVYYGGLPNPLDLLDNIQAPILAVYGEDEGEKANELEKELKARNKSVDKHIYPGAGHGFFNDTGGNHHADAAADAWTKTLAFLKTNV